MYMQTLRNRHLLLLDLPMIIGAVYFSYVLRLEQLSVPERWLPGMVSLVIVLSIITPLIFRRAGVYSRFWRYASVDEIVLVGTAWAIAVVAASLLTMGISLVWGNALAVPRSIPVILLLFGLSVTAGPRFLVRILSRRAQRAPAQARQHSRRILIMGAGDAGAIIARELQENPHLGMQATGFLDDDPQKQGGVIHGLQVLGTRNEIVRIATDDKIDQVIIAMPTATGKDIREVVDICEAAGVQTKIVPGVYELLDSKVSVNQVRNVEIEDLLRREPIRTDIAKVQNLIAGRRVLLTGGGGSIGSELARQIYQCGPAELILMGHGENSVFNIFHELQARQPLETINGSLPANGKPAESVVLHPVIADTRSPERMRAIMEEYRPQIVFHAAAHKHVPLMELNPAEAILNNVLGTHTLVQAAGAAGVERLVMISTDKAVNPTSVMGATKRVAELLVHQSAIQYGKPYVAVRFGNVLGSRGSVLQTFRKQISAGKSLTITHPDMTRYFMTIPEAVQLVLQASVLGKGGEVFVLDMGKPVRIVDLAEDLIRLSGLEPGRDIDIVYTGLRPGEKLFEELFVHGEDSYRTEHAQIFTSANAAEFVPVHLDETVCKLADAAHDNNLGAIIHLLRDLLPEFQPLETYELPLPVHTVEQPPDLRERV